MGFINNLNFKPKLIGFALFIGLIPLIFIAVISINKADDALMEESFAKLQSVQQLKKVQIEAYFQTRESLLKDVKMNLRFTDGLPLFSAAFHNVGTEGLEYSRLVQKREDGFYIFMENFGFYDVFLIDPDGYVVYTVAKESDLGVNLNDPKWHKTGLGMAFSQSQKGNALIDFAWYEPSNEPASFIATPLHNKTGIYIGSAIFQISLGDITTIMQERSGMGETGETYLVGHDKKMRSNSYLDPQGHSVKASFEGTIKENGVDTKASNEAIAGRGGSEIIEDYNGNQVLSVFSPIELPGDLKWAIIAEIDLAEVQIHSDELMFSIFWTAIIIALIVSLIAMVFATSISKPIKQVADAAQWIADGDLTVEIDIDQEDEIGQLAEVFRTMVENLQKMVREITENATTISSSATEFSAISEQMMGSSENMDEKTSTVASASEEINVNMSTISTAATQSSQNIEVIASSTEEMTATVREISENTANAREISSNAVKTVNDALEKVSTLRITANDIGKVIDVILEIAEQTKLLALNATIESARAGDAGKGFAVVANEVKELAKQTNEAVEDIQIKVLAIQNSTGETIDQIKGIDSVIIEVNEIVSSIATSVEEQSVTTKDIAGNISQAADGIKEMTHSVAEAAGVTSEIAKDVSSLSKNSSDVKSGSLQVNTGVTELSRMGENLTALVKTFKLN